MVDPLEAKPCFIGHQTTCSASFSCSFASSAEPHQRTPWIYEHTNFESCLCVQSRFFVVEANPLTRGKFSPADPFSRWVVFDRLGLDVFNGSFYGRIRNESTHIICLRNSSAFDEPSSKLDSDTLRSSSTTHLRRLQKRSMSHIRAVPVLMS